MDKLKWYTLLEYVDSLTGEILTKNTVERKYIVIKKLKKITTNGNNGTRTITYECIRNGQYELFGDD